MQIPSPRSGYASATTAASPKKHKVALDRKRMIRRVRRETSLPGLQSISSQIKQM
jgi:hypothetical protein